MVYFKKRKEFYDSIKDISFNYNVDIKNLDEKDLLEFIEHNLEDLINAIKHRKKSSKKSESNIYLKPVMEAADNALKQVKKGKIEDKTAQYLSDLREECYETADAKFSIKTFGAVLEYKPTLDKFLELANEISKLSVTLLDYLGIRKIDYFDMRAPTIDKSGKFIRKVNRKEINIAVLGDPGVGKTSLIKNLCGKVSENTKKKGIECIHTTFYDGKTRYNNIYIFEIKNELKDIDDSFARTLTKFHFAIIMHDMNYQVDEPVLERLYTASEAMKSNNPRCHVIFVGNKEDVIKKERKDSAKLAQFACNCEDKQKYKEFNPPQDYAAFLVTAKFRQGFNLIKRDICDVIDVL